MESWTNLSRLSLNQKTTENWTLPEAVDGCQRAGLAWIGLWREKVQLYGLTNSKRLLATSGLQVSSLCRGGWFPAASKAERKERIEDNRRAIAEAAELGAPLLVLVCGPAPDRDLVAARVMVEDAIAQLLPEARAAGVKLGIEPLHPMFAADRSVIVTLAEANRLVQTFNTDGVGVVVDAYHVWWDPDLSAQLAQAGEHILGFHISDWPRILPDPLLGRVMMGDGVIDLRLLRTEVERTGYRGPIEVEIFNRAIWETEGDEILRLLKERYLSCC